MVDDKNYLFLSSTIGMECEVRSSVFVSFCRPVVLLLLAVLAASTYMPAAKLLSRLCSRASVDRFRMRSHPCFATGVNIALLSLLLRGAAGFRW